MQLRPASPLSRFRRRTMHPRAGALRDSLSGRDSHGAVARADDHFGRGADAQPAIALATPRSRRLLAPDERFATDAIAPFEPPRRSPDGRARSGRARVIRVPRGAESGLRIGG